MLFSIAIVVSRGNKYLDNALESARLQSLEDAVYEILIVDNGTTEKTRALMDTFAERIANVRLIRNACSRAHGLAYNQAVDAAMGEYIVFLDADGALRSDALEQYRLQLVDKNIPDIVFADFVNITASGETRRLPLTNRLDFVSEYKRMTIKGMRTFKPFGAAYNKGFLNRWCIRFSNRENYDYIEFVTRTTLWAEDVIFIPQVLYYGKESIDSLTMPLCISTIDDAVLAIEAMVTALKENGSLKNYLADWQLFACKFFVQLRQRITLSLNPSIALISLLDERINASDILKKHGLTTHLAIVADEYEDNASVKAVLMREAAAGAVVFLADINYQIRNFVAVAKRLEETGVKTIICDVSGSRRFSIRREIPKHEWDASAPANYFKFDIDECFPLFLNASAYVMSSDWGSLRALVFELKRYDIPVIGFYEGINDDLLAEPPRPPKKKFLPYRNFTYLLLPGDYYTAIYSKQKTRVIGLPILRTLATEEPVFPVKPLVVINVNFSYGVLEEGRDIFVQTAVAACDELGINYILTKHPADLSNLSHHPISQDSVYNELRRGSLLISRFSTCILESLALGKPVIYHNPHGEKFPKYKSTLGAFEVSDTTDSLVEAIRRVLGDIKMGVDFRLRSQNFLQIHTNFYSEHSPEYLAADAIKEVMKATAENYSNRLLQLSATHHPVHSHISAPVNANLQLLESFARATTATRAAVLFLLGQAQLKKELHKNKKNRLVRFLGRLLS